MPIIDRRDRGATGEGDVGAILDRMVGEGWLTVRDIANERGNVDHVVVGPGIRSIAIIATIATSSATTNVVLWKPAIPAVTIATTMITASAISRRSA